MNSVYRIDSVEIQRTIRGGVSIWRIVAKGTVPTGGWSNGRLIQNDLSNPELGYFEFDFVADPPRPGEIVTNALEPIEAEDYLLEEPNVQTYRIVIHSDRNAFVVEGYPVSGNDKKHEQIQIPNSDSLNLEQVHEGYHYSLQDPPISLDFFAGKNTDNSYKIAYASQSANWEYSAEDCTFIGIERKFYRFRIYKCFVYSDGSFNFLLSDRPNRHGDYPVFWYGSHGELFGVYWCTRKRI